MFIFSKLLHNKDDSPVSEQELNDLKDKIEKALQDPNNDSVIMTNRNVFMQRIEK